MMVRRIQILALVLLAIVSIALIVVWTSGLLETDDGEGSEWTLLLKYSWEAEGSNEEPDTIITSEAFHVAHGSTGLRLTYDVDLPSEQMSGFEFLGQTYYFEPEVTFRLKDPIGVVKWERTFYRTVTDSVTLEDPVRGLWTLEVEATGYHVELPGTEVSDSVRITIDGA